MKLRNVLAGVTACAMLLVPVCGAGTKDNGKTKTNRNSILWEKETEIAETVTLTETIFDNGERQNERYISYTPSTTVRPEVVFGDTLCERLSFAEVEALEEAGTRRMLAGINGDYFVLKTGMPLGIVVENGNLISSDAGNYAIGFQSDGTAIYGKPGLKMNIQLGDEVFKLNGMNKDLASGGFTLYTRAWGEETGVTQKVWNVILKAKSWEDPEMNTTIEYTVEECCLSEESVTIPEDGCVLCLPANSDERRIESVKELERRDTVTLEIKLTDDRFEDCICAMGSLYPLILEGEIQDDLDEIDRSKAPRTAVGILEDGTVLLYTVDGRQSGYSTGLTLQEAAQRLLELGCVDAGAMDGGASTVIGAQLPGTESCAIRNKPSNGEQREVPIYLVLTAKGKGSRRLRTLSILSDAQVLLAGQEIQFSVGGCDECGAPVKVKEPVWDCDIGRIDEEDGSYIAPERTGTAEITVEVDDIIGTLEIPIINKPDTVTIRDEKTRETVTELVMKPGESIDLTAEAYWEGLQLYASDEDFRWSISGGIGEVTEDGTYTAGDVGAIGLLRVSAGKGSGDILVRVQEGVLCADGFESHRKGTSEGLSWFPETLRDKVKYGTGSLRLEYDLKKGLVSFPMSDYDSGVSTYASIWVWYDGSGNRLYAKHANETVLLGSMDRTGWQLVTMEPGKYGELKALELQGKGTGTIWLDQFLLSEKEADTEAPCLSMQLEGTRISAQISDASDQKVPNSRVKLTLDGESLLFTYDAESGKLTARADTSDGKPHRVTLTASDSSGNYNSVSILKNGTESGPFSDMSGHWAENYVNELAARNLVNGRSDGNGSYVFDPDSPITRAEFAVMLCRWLDVDTEGYSDELNKFEDRDSIPEWARDGAAAAAALGLIQGSADDERLYFRPQDTLTRAQAAVVLGRTMSGGRMGSDLPFADASQIPDWAADYISQFAFMGIMRGDGVNFSPNGKLTRGQTAKLLSELG